jgi:hypothetical protein
MQKEPMNIFERWGVMTIAFVVIAAVCKGCMYA